ncbi:MAG: LysR family transcriptional regulator [Pelosinus sp.]|nr:LysR family transcriptional regulator [Pelosinus sp.]
MELLQLKYFQVVARLENVTRAAEELHIAQPSLSKIIARLEKDVGVSLFERSGKRLRLNEFGKAFLKRVERSINELAEGKRELADLANFGPGSITVGATSARLLPNLLTEYLTQHPHGQFRFLQITNQLEIQKRLLNGEIDLCLSFLPIDQPKIHCQPLAIEEIFLAVSPEHRLSGRNSIQLNEVANESFISLTSECGLREITNKFCKQAGFIPTIAFEINSLDVISSLVIAGLGIAFLPAFWRYRNSIDTPVQLRIENPTCQRTIWLAWVKERYMSVSTQKFSKFVIEYFSRNSRNEHENKV